MKKITFVGDILCEPLMLKNAYKNGNYNFDEVFVNMKNFFEKSDYIVGNLETPVAGADMKFTNGLFKFNAPDEFVEAIKNAKIDFLTTATNHCLDRGLEGLKRTIKILDKNNIKHTGTFLSKDDKKEASYFEIDKNKFAIISYTYGTNYYNNKIFLDENNEFVNLLEPIYVKQKVFKGFSNKLKNKVYKVVFKLFKEEFEFYLKKFLGMKINNPYKDDNLDIEAIKPFLENLKNDIKKAKENADFVFFCPHTGGQFNIEVGKFTEYIFEKAVEFGCDAVVGTHPHVVQKYEFSKIPMFFSLGNFSMSPNSVYLIKENLPQYGIATHFYFEKSTLKKITFSILKMIEEKKEILKVFPVYDLSKDLNSNEKNELEKDIQKIYFNVTGNQINESILEEEYILWENTL